MPPFALYLLSTLTSLAVDTGGPVRTCVLADLLDASPRTVRWYLHGLETRGLVARRTPKTGWLVPRLVV